jgi:methyl-accepting chemotaxis protein
MIGKSISLFFKVVFGTCALAIAFLTCALLWGGKPYRATGDAVRRATYEVGRTADLIRKTFVDLRRNVHDAAESIKATGDDIKDTTGKAVDTAIETGRKIETTADETVQKVSSGTRKIANAVGGE